MNNTTHYQRNREIVLNRENGKERLRELATDKYRNLSEEAKERLRVALKK